MENVIGKVVTVKVDRPIGSAHPRFPDMIYTVNYGYVKGIKAPDGEWQDAYIIGVDRPLETFDGVVAAIIVRRDDVEAKWVVVPESYVINVEEIKEKTHFCEKYFDSTVII